MDEAKWKKRLEQYPAIADLEARARRRIPHVAWEYLSMGTGDDRALARNREKLADITFLPRLLREPLEPDTRTTLLGQTYNAPFGVAPVGLTGLMWPRAEQILAQTAVKYRIPYCLSTVATQTPETIGPLAGDVGWFQLYPPRETAVRSDLLQRAWDSGFRTMLVTADVPGPSRRERASRAGLRMPPRITPSLIWQGMQRPAWSMATLREGLPSLKTMEKYAQSGETAELASFVRQKIGGTLSWNYLREVRDQWPGRLLLKGLLHPADAEEAVAVGVDGIVVSNHGARQFDGAPAAIEALPAIVEQVRGRAHILFDSGVRSGLDIMRALALGAEFVLMGRPFIFGVAAFGDDGGDHAAEILLADLKTNMIQCGFATLADIRLA